MSHRSFKGVLTKFIMFSSTSMVGTVVDLGCHWLMCNILFSGYFGQFILAPLISFELAALTNFTIAYHWVWRERIDNRSVRTFWKRFLIYNASATGVFVVKLGSMQVIHLIFPGLYPVLCNLIALCISGGLNFFMNEWILFKEKDTSPEEKKEEETGPSSSE